MSVGEWGSGAPGCSGLLLCAVSLRATGAQYGEGRVRWTLSFDGEPPAAAHLAGECLWGSGALAIIVILLIIAQHLLSDHFFNDRSIV